MIWNAIPIVGKVLNNVLGLVDQAVEDKDEAKKIKADLTKVFNNSDLTKFTKQIQAQMSVILAEVKGAWLQRNWRPMLMCLFGIIIANNYIINPWFNELFELNVIMEVPEQMWSLLKLGVSGYVVGRSVEKGLDIWKKGRN